MGTSSSTLTIPLPPPFTSAITISLSGRAEPPPPPTHSAYPAALHVVARRLDGLDEVQSRIVGEQEAQLRREEARMRQILVFLKELATQRSTSNDNLELPALPPPPPPQLLKAAEVLEEPLDEIIRKAKEQVGVDCINHYNFAVCGQTGVGKSSFINGALSLEGDGACRVGEVETTHLIKGYYSDKWPSLKLWDVPGAGTNHHSSHRYFEDKKLFVFDAILILCSDRFLSVDLDILQSARKYGTPCVFVRTKCDIAIQRRAKRDKVYAFEAAQRIRGDVARSFVQEYAHAGLQGSPPRLFFISNEFLTQHDEDQEHGPYALYDSQGKVWDDSLKSMDELALISFVLEAANKRGSRHVAPHDDTSPMNPATSSTQEICYPPVKEDPLEELAQEDVLEEWAKQLIA